MLFPFGHGLSYTSFAYSGLRTDKDAMTEGKTLCVSVDVANTGLRAGRASVQLYVRAPRSAVRRPVRELRDFAKVSLEPGETKTVRFTLDRRAFAYYEPKVHDFYVESGQYVVEIGESSRDIRLAKTVAVEGSARLPFAADMTTPLGRLVGHPACGSVIADLIAAFDTSSDREQTAAMGEGSEKMMRNMALEMPLGAAVSFGHMSAEELQNLIDKINNSTQ